LLLAVAAGSCLVPSYYYYYYYYYYYCHVGPSHPTAGGQLSSIETSTPALPG
jgi:hypothetical protein